MNVTCIPGLGWIKPSRVSSCLALLFMFFLGGPAWVKSAIFTAPTRSTTIALTSDDNRVVVVNRQGDSVSIIEVRDAAGSDSTTRLAEIDVGDDPRFVALTPDDQEAYVTNAADGTVSVIDLGTHQVTHTIDVGNEPRGIAITPHGAYAFVALHTEGKVAVISTLSKRVINTVRTGGNPQAIVITNNGNDDDDDERVFSTLFFSQLIDPKKRPDGFDDAKQGVVRSFTVGDALSRGVQAATHVLKPLANSGFVGDRRSFCLKTRQVLQDQGDENGMKTVFFNSGPIPDGTGAAELAQTDPPEVFCPDPNSTDASSTGPIAKTPQGVYPNALHAALIRGNDLFVPNEGAAPEPPLFFNVNVQYLVGVIDIPTGQETNRTVNVNAQIAKEPAPGKTDPVLTRAFGNTPGGIDANRTGKRFLLASRGGNYVIEATVDSQGKLDIGAPEVIRYQTGNIPTGVVMSADEKRAYTNNEVSTSVTSIDLVNQQVLQQDINSSDPPAPGTQAHRNTVGKLVFFTALGTPDQGVFQMPIRDIVPVQFRGKASDSAWSSCASCHDDGRTDDVAWSFETGPRRSIDLSGTTAPSDPDDQRIMNWSAVRGSASTDFNNNSRNVQGGIGFAANVNGQDRSLEIFNHGFVTGISDALDAMDEWIRLAIRPLNMPDPDPTVEQRGRGIFADNCASCHGGAKWTKSRTSPVYINDPTYLEDPIGVNFFLPVPPIDPRLVVANPQIRAVNDPVAGMLTFMDDVGTFDPKFPTELRGSRGATIAGQDSSGFTALPVNALVGFNAASLQNAAYHAPFLHNGRAPTLGDVFALHRLPQFEGAPTIEQRLNARDQAALAAFVNGIDGNTAPLESDTDQFLK